MVSSTGSPVKNSSSYSERMASHLRDSERSNPAIYEGSTLSQHMPSQDRWAAIKGHARNISATNSQDELNERSAALPPIGERLRGKTAVDEVPVLGASSLPVADDPLPEIGHFDDSKSDVTTNPSIIHGPLDGDAAGKNWPYALDAESDARRIGHGSQASRSVESVHSHEPGFVDTGLMAAAAGGTAALIASHSKRQPTVQDDEYDETMHEEPGIHKRSIPQRDATPTSPALFRDEGYVTDAHARSSGALTPLLGTLVAGQICVTFLLSAYRYYFWEGHR